MVADHTVSSKIPNNYRVRRIFFGGPSDTVDERELFPTLIEHINKIKAHSIGLHLVPIGWESAVPGWGRPQERINNELRRADLVVLTFRTRWGSPTGQFSSGTEEEFEISRECKHRDGRPDLFLFFNRLREHQLLTEDDQLTKLLRFRKDIEAKRFCLYVEYGNLEDWRIKLTESVCAWIDGIEPRLPGPVTLNQEDLDKLQIAIQELANLRESRTRGTENRLRALQLVQRATEAARNAQFVEADELFASAGSISTEPELLNILGTYLRHRGFFKDALIKFQELSSLANKLGAVGQEWLAVAENNIGITLHSLGEPRRAQESYRKALAINEALGRDHARAANLANLAPSLLQVGEVDQALRSFEMAASLMRKLGNKSGLATVLGNWAVAKKDHGAMNEAKALCEESIKLYQECSSLTGRAEQLSNLANIHFALGDLKRAGELHREVLEIERGLGRQNGIVAELLGLADICWELGEVENGLEILKEAGEVALRIGAKENLARVYNKRGALSQSVGDVENARLNFEVALRMFEEMEHVSGVAEACTNLANLEGFRGNIGLALELHQRALKSFESVLDKSGTAASLNNLGYLHLHQNNVTKAKEAFLRALQINEQIGSKKGVAINLSNIGVVSHLAGQFAQAKDFYLRALKLDEELGRAEGVAFNCKNLGQVELALGEKTEGLRLLETSLTIYREIGNKAEAANVEAVIKTVR